MMIGYGIFAWGGEERRSDRYGSVVLNGENFNCDAEVKSFVNAEAVSELVAKRVRLTAKVMETRQSGHIGDVFLGIRPTTPEVGEAIELGVGILGVGEAWEPSLTKILLEPEDGRQVFWMDPHLLYRLHDQTVELYAEETGDSCHEAPKIGQSEEGVQGTGETSDDGGGVFQTKGVKVGDIQSLAQVEHLEPGMFMISGPDLSRGVRSDVLLKNGRTIPK